MGKIENLDFKKNTLRKINNYLQNISYKNNKREFTVKNPSGHHAICAGLTENIFVKIKWTCWILLWRYESKSTYYY